MSDRDRSTIALPSPMGLHEAVRLLLLVAPEATAIETAMAEPLPHRRLRAFFNALRAISPTAPVEAAALMHHRTMQMQVATSPTGVALIRDLAAGAAANDIMALIEAGRFLGIVPPGGRDG